MTLRISAVFAPEKIMNNEVMRLRLLVYSRKLIPQRKAARK